MEGIGNRIGIVFSWWMSKEEFRRNVYALVPHLITQDLFGLNGMEHRYDLAETVVYVKHPELPRVERGGCALIYNLNDAKKRFPYLFAQTNAILYRNFTKVCRKQKKYGENTSWDEFRFPEFPKRKVD